MLSSCRLARAAASKAAPNSSSTTTQFAEMVLSEEKFRGLCADLNIDRNTADEAWRNYETISTNYTLEVTEQAP